MSIITKISAKAVLSLAVCSSWLIVPLLTAQENLLTLSLDRENGIYHEGETARVTVEVNPDTAAESGWQGRITVRNGWRGEPREMNWKVGQGSYTFEVQDPGPGLVLADAALLRDDDESSAHNVTIGLLFQPSSIELSTAEPADFDDFWQSQMASWRALPHTAELTPVESSQSGLESWNLTIDIAGEMPVSGYLSRPKDAGRQSLPAILILHGAGVRSANLSVAEYWAGQGFLALDINAHGLPNNQSDAYYQELSQNQLARYRRDGVLSREEWYFRTMFLRVISATDHLASHPDWNQRDLVLYGSSQGGAQVLAGAGLDPRVSLAVASVPAMCDLSGYLLNREPGWPKAMADTTPQSQREQINRTFQYYDGGNFARRIEAPLIVSLGLIDRVCPADGIQAAINNVPGEVIPLYRPDMAHLFPSDIRLEFLQHIRQKLRLR